MFKVLHRPSVFTNRWLTHCYIFSPISYVKVKLHFFSICFVCAQFLCFSSLYIYIHVCIYIYIYIYMYVYIYIYFVLKKYSSMRLPVSCCSNHQVYIICDLKIEKMYYILSIQKYPFMCMSETVKISFYIFKQ